MNLFRVGGIQLAVHFSFFLLLAVNAFDGWADAGWPGLWWSSGLLFAFFTCVVLHELGHCFTAMRYGVSVPRILLLPIGGMAEFDGIPREPRRELLITLAGPAVNFALAGLLWLVLPAGSRLDEDSAAAVPTLLESAHLLMLWNVGMGLFNFLPAFPMDGGRILRALLALRLPYLRATFWAVTTGKVLCVIGAVLAAYYQSFLVALFIFIFIIGELEYRAVRRRELEEAHWRAVLARLHANSYPPPLEEPPVLRS
ncbi:MAG: site-2 protease family protein [Verrucomicrobia bacterium]|nr:site-2 protease family protein [Verrucomicrobiota bacterium]